MAKVDTWEFTRKQAHPKARARLDKAFYWNEGDDHSPLGNDTGRDTARSYRDWCSDRRRAGVRRFLEQLMQGWALADTDWDLLDAERLQGQLPQDGYQILTRDDMVIGLAFTQMILEGKVDPEVQRVALLAVQRQSLDVVIAFREWDNPKKRKTRLEHMRAVLTLDWS